MIDLKLMALKPLLKYMLIPLLIVAAAAFYKAAPWIKEDNPVEEKIEQVIHSQSGYDIDLSPESKE